MIPVVVIEEPLAPTKRTLEVPAGVTLAEAAGHAELPRALTAVVLSAGSGEVPPRERHVPASEWAEVRLAVGDILVFAPPVADGNWRTWFNIGMSVAAIAANFIPVVGPFVSAGIMATTIAVNMAFPPPQRKLTKDSESPTLFIRGARNTARLWEAVPQVLGRHRIVPPYAAEAYTEIVGDDQYLRLVFALGYGPITIEDVRIGETSLSSFQDVETEYRRGYKTFTDRGSWSASSGVFPSNPAFGDLYTATSAGTIGGVAYAVGDTITFNGLAASTSAAAWDKNQNTPLRLYPSDVHEQALSILVTTSGGSQVRTTVAGIDEVSLDVVFARGLAHIDSKGRKKTQHVTVRIERSPTGAGQWALVEDRTVSGRQLEPLRATVRFWVPRGPAYDVRVTRLTPDMDLEQNPAEVTWTTMRTFTNDSPVNFPEVALYALRIKASGQLRDVIDEFNCICQTIAPDWDGNTWVTRPTSNPAALYRMVLQGPANARPQPDSALDLPRLQHWAEFCTATGFACNAYLDARTTVDAILADIASAGRATPALRGGLRSVVIDELQTVPVQLFTPRNTQSYSGELAWPDIPHAFRVDFANQMRDWDPDERIVYDDGYSASNATKYERLELFGCTSAALAWKIGRYHLAQRRLRAGLHTFEVDFEHLRAERGDLVLLAHDVIAVGLAALRIRALVTAGGQTFEVTLDGPVTIAAGKSYALRVRRPDGAIALHAVLPLVGTTETLALATPVATSEGPQPGDLAVFGESGTETIECIIARIERMPNLAARITAVAAAPAVHVADVGTIPTHDPTARRPATMPAPVVSQMTSDATVMVVTPSGSLESRVVFRLAAPSPAPRETLIWHKLTGTDGAWLNARPQTLSTGELAVGGLLDGETYDFRLQYLHPDYRPSPVTVVSGYTVVGRSAPPAALDNLSIAAVGGAALLRWDLPADLDVRIGGTIHFRHSPLMSGATWPESTAIGETVQGNQTHAWLPLVPGTYLVRIVDSGLRESAVASVTTKQASVLTFVPVASLVQDPTFSGTKTNLIVEANQLRLGATDTFDGVADVDALADWDAVGSAVTTSGTYVFAAGFDFASVRRRRLTAHLKAITINPYDTIDARGPIDAWPDMDGVAGAPCDAHVEVRLTDDDPAGSPTWGPWQRLSAAEVQCRGVEARALLSTSDPTYTIAVTELRLSADEVQ